jgi:hypothetical protein
MTMDVVIGGSVLQRPSAGGHAWALAQWALGVAAIGGSVKFVDRGEPAAGRNGVADVLETRGVSYEVLPDEPTARPANGSRPDLLLNIMGFVPSASIGATQSVFLDIDPGYPQIWRALGLSDPFSGHDRFVTIGENLGRADCKIPDCELDWITTPPPVVLEDWPVTPPGTAFTSVCTWRNPYGTLEWEGSTFGSRVHEFRQFLELPRLVDAEFELALDIDAAESRDLSALEANGWRLVDPTAAAGTPRLYRSYVQRSRAEFSVAQNMYVTGRSGWLSDRTLCYLASGKPVLAQDTGFSDNYPVGEGLLAYSTLEEAAAGVEAIQSGYERHSRAARAMAEEYFDSKKVLGRLLARLGLAVEAA